MMNNIEMIKDKASQAEVVARKVLLASLGAYGKGFEETKSRFGALTTDSNKMFADLVVKGEKLETEGKNKLAEVKTNFFAKSDLSNRVAAVRTKLGLNKTDSDQEVAAIHAKIDSLTAAIAKLSAKPVTKPVVKTAATK